MNSTPFPMSEQLAFRFSGKTFEHDRDFERLGKQMRETIAYMISHDWVTLAEVGEAIGAPEASVSARLRDMRNKYGYEVERRYVANGLHQYRAR